MYVEDREPEGYADDQRWNPFNANVLINEINSTGRERRKKSVKPDRISLHAREARRMGLSYGRYMAKYHPVRPVEPVEDVSDETYLKQNREHRICPVCGKRFSSSRSDRMYCSETCRHQANRVHAAERKVVSHGRKVCCVADDGTITSFGSITEAARDTGVDQHTIRNVIASGERYKGLVFRDEF